MSPTAPLLSLRVLKVAVGSWRGGGRGRAGEEVEEGKERRGRGETEGERGRERKGGVERERARERERERES